MFFFIIIPITYSISGKDAEVKTTDNGVNSVSASKDGDKDTKDAVKETESVPKDGDKVVKDTVEDVNNDLEMSDSEDSRDCSAFKKVQRVPQKSSFVNIKPTCNLNEPHTRKKPGDLVFRSSIEKA